MDIQGHDDGSFCREKIGCNPDVKGYRLLIMAPQMPEKTSGGIILTDQTRGTQRRAYNVGLVLKVGPTAFVDKFEDRRVAVGDWIHYSIYDREEVYIDDKRLCYYINDEKVYAKLSEEDLKVFVREMQ